MARCPDSELYWLHQSEPLASVGTRTAHPWPGHLRFPYIMLSEPCLFDGLRQWSLAVPEPAAILLLGMAVILGGRSSAAGHAA